MSRRCDICGRGPQTAVSRSHSNIATKRRQYVNLQTKNIFGQNNPFKNLLKDDRIIKKCLTKKASPFHKIDVENEKKTKIKICAKCLKILKRELERI
ncbi:50S ribosomal protein L28 [bacterium]|nr:50S ribosomal protein L28 [bacterium]